MSQALRSGRKNGIKEVSQRVPPIFGRASIMLGISPQSAHILAAYNFLCSGCPTKSARLFAYDSVTLNVTENIVVIWSSHEH